MLRYKGKGESRCAMIWNMYVYVKRFRAWKKFSNGDSRIIVERHTRYYFYTYIFWLSPSHSFMRFLYFLVHEMKWNIFLFLSLSLSLSSSESGWNSFIMHVSKFWVRIDMYISIRMPTSVDKLIASFNFNIINSYGLLYYLNKKR